MGLFGSDGWLEQNIYEPAKSLGGSFQKEVATDIFNMDDLSYEGGIAAKQTEFDAAPDSLRGDNWRDPIITPEQAEYDIGWTDQYGRHWPGTQPVMSGPALQNYGSNIGRGEGRNTLGQGFDTMVGHRGTSTTSRAGIIDQDRFEINPETNLWDMNEAEIERRNKLNIDLNLHPLAELYPDLYGLEATDETRTSWADEQSGLIYGSTTDEGTPPDEVIAPVLGRPSETTGLYAGTETGTETGTGVGVPTNTNQQFNLSAQSQGLFDAGGDAALQRFRTNLFDPTSGQLAGLENAPPPNWGDYGLDPFATRLMEEAEEGTNQSRMDNLYALDASMGLLGSNREGSLAGADIAEANALRDYGGTYRRQRSNIGQQMGQAGVSLGSTAYQSMMSGAAGSAAAGRRDIGQMYQQERNRLNTDYAGRMVSLITGTAYTPSVSPMQGYNVGLNAGQAGVGSEPAGGGGGVSPFQTGATAFGTTFGLTGNLPAAAVIGLGAGIYQSYQNTQDEDDRPTPADRLR